MRPLLPIIRADRRRRGRIMTAITAGIVVFAGVATTNRSAVASPSASPGVADLQAAWDAAATLLREDGRTPVTLSADDLATIAKGGIARHRQRLDGVDRAVGATWSALDRDALWIAILDDTCDTLVSGLTERRLPGAPPGHKLLYQHVDAPWPFADRQWVIDIVNNAALAAASHGVVWERRWSVVADQPGRAAVLDPGDGPAPDAIWTPVNEGGWLLVEAGGGTLVVYHARVDVGGAIPDGLATTWTLGTLRGMLRHVVERAGEIPGHYDAAHAPVLRVDGSPVPPW